MRRIDSISHDANNLLGVILNFSTLLGRRIGDETDADVVAIQQAARQVGEHIERMAALTKACTASGPTRDRNFWQLRAVRPPLTAASGD